MILYKKMFDLLKEKGYNAQRIKDEGILSQSTIARIRKGEGGLAHENINKLCLLLNCKPEDLMEFIYTDSERAEIDKKIEELKRKHSK